MDPKEPEIQPDEEKKEDKSERYRTMMVGEAPGEDLGYDPATIPTEPLEPEEDD
tara:strand:+ start:4530 stop:4691 length:162 start_codon:yes stop_codon:yes gene_type:complete